MSLDHYLQLSPIALRNHVTRVTDALFKEKKKVRTRCKRAPDEDCKRVSTEMSLDDYLQLSPIALRP